MQVPVRLVLALRPQVHVAVLLSVGVATVVFTASPFLIGDVADHYAVGLGSAALISTSQLGGFGLAAFGAGRWLTGIPRLFLLSGLILVGVNLASALVPPLPILVALRFAAGAAMGVASWLAWTTVFGDRSETSEVSTVGPLVGIIAAPLIAPMAAAGGIAGTYLLLAAVAALPLLLTTWVGQPPLPLVAEPDVRARSRPVPQAMVILTCLGLFSMGGSSVWMFTTRFGEDRGLSLTTLAWAFSANAMAGVISARWSGRRGPAGVWVAATGVLALLITTQSSGQLQLVAMAAWGFCFWMGIPAAFHLLAGRSRFPEERAGDAQVSLAVGRVLGPTVGGLMLDNAGAAALGLLAAGIMIGTGLVLVTVARAGREPVALAAVS